MIVGITGYAQHGKDTSAKVLVEEFDFVRVGFADALKELALKVDPIVSYHPDALEGLMHVVNDRLSYVVQHQGWEAAKKLPEVRRFLQVLGTEARNVLGEDVWVHALDNTLRERMTAANVVIPDVRFPNEANYVVNHRGGELWRVTRRTSDGTDYDNGIGTEHDSEKHVPNLRVDQEIFASSVEELQAKVRLLTKWGTHA